MADAGQFLMLIKISDKLKGDLPFLAESIRAIEEDYMGKFGKLGASVAHAALIGPWDFAVWFHGSPESAIYLAAEIARKAPGESETLTMPAFELDEFTSRFARRG
jgi:hypothetical protein